MDQSRSIRSATAAALPEAKVHAIAPNDRVNNPIPLDLNGLIAPYRHKGRFSLRLENMPQGARLSAGRNRGDGSWSIGTDELDHLLYFPPATTAGDHALALRLISLDEGRSDSSTLALIDFRLSDVSRDSKASGSVVQLANSAVHTEPALRNQIAELRRKLVQRETELKSLRTERDQSWLPGRNSNQKLTGAARPAPGGAKSDPDLPEIEATNQLKQIEQQLLEARARESPVEGQLRTCLRSLDQKTSELNSLKDNITQERQTFYRSITDAQCAIDEHEEKQGRLERQLRVTETEFLALKKAQTDALSALEVSRTSLKDREEEITQLKLRIDDLQCPELMRQKTDAARTATQVGAASNPRLDQALNLLSQREQENVALKLQLACEKRAKDEQRAELAAALERAARDADDKQQYFSAVQQEMEKRCKTLDGQLELALRDSRSGVDDGYIASLNRQIKTLEALLVDREAELAKLVISPVVEQAPLTTSTTWKPLKSDFRTAARSERVSIDNNKRLFREAAILFVIVAVTFLVFPFVWENLPHQLIWQSQTEAYARGGAAVPERSKIAAAQVHAQTSALQSAIVIKTANLRSAPFMTAVVTTSLRHGITVTVLRKQGNWSLVQPLDNSPRSSHAADTGWVYSSLLKQS